ncbi:MAG TPA: hypothetical protein VLV31_00305 [Candidatus Acidoferrales bacterium]|nr:hypothetical protein [Candidatus Acidoferrales bacterium]
MVLCIVAMVVFSVMSLGSAKYKRLSREAMRCVFKNLTFSPCDVQLEQKIKGKVTAKLLRFPTLARFFYRNFKIIAWAFTISFFASLAYTVYALYNYFAYGTCDPGQVCPLNEIGFLTLKFENLLVFAVPVIVLLVVVYLLVSHFRQHKTAET